MTTFTSKIVICGLVVAAVAIASGVVARQATVPRAATVEGRLSNVAPRAAANIATSPAAAVPVDLNIVALLDLSDRISPALHPKQANKDRMLLHDLLDLIEARARRQLFVASRDRLRIVIARQADSGYDPSDYADGLTIDMRTIFAGGKPAFDKAKARLQATTDRLYDAATKTERYTGANIPLFFRDHLPGYIDPPEHGRAVRNVLVVVTDGYIELDRKVRATIRDVGHRTADMRLPELRRPDWKRVFDQGDYGLIVPDGSVCNGTDVLVMEINIDPRHLDDKELIVKYWGKWLAEMGCGRTEFQLTEDASTQTSAALGRFLSVQ